MENQRRGLLIERVAEAMFNWQVHPSQGLKYSDETMRTEKYRQLARIAVREIENEAEENERT